MSTPANLTACGLIIQYWRPDLNVAIWVTVFGIAVILTNVSPILIRLPSSTTNCGRFIFRFYLGLTIS